MEPEVHIIEQYLQHFRSFFTRTNIRLKRGKEIDILAVDAFGLDRYHIECRVATTRQFKLVPGDAPKKGLDWLLKEKFDHPFVSSDISSVFKTSDYKRVLVVWDASNEALEEAKKKNLEIWKMPEILKEMSRNIRGKGHRDDILRVIDLMSKDEREKPL